MEITLKYSEGKVIQEQELDAETIKQDIEAKKELVAANKKQNTTLNAEIAELEAFLTDNNIK